MKNKNSMSKNSISEQIEDQAIIGTDQQNIISGNKDAFLKDIVLFVKQLCLGYSQFSLYPPDHPVTRIQIKSAWDELIPVLRKYGNISLSFADGKLLFFGMPVEEKNLAVNKFIHHVEGLHIKSIEFLNDLTFEEFAVFITLIGQETGRIAEEGEIDSLLKKKGINNIRFNSAVYQVVRKNQTIVNDAIEAEKEKNSRIQKVMEIKSTDSDMDKAKKIMVKYLQSDGSLQAIRQLLKSVNMNPETVSRIIQSIKRIMDETGLEADELIRYLEQQISHEERLKKEKQKKISKKFQSLADRIREKLKTDFKDIKEKNKLIEYLDNVYNREISRVVEAKTAELQDRIERDKETFLRIGDAIQQTDIGLIILDDYGKICFLRHTEVLPIPLTLGEDIPPELFTHIKSSRESRHWKIEQTRIGQIRFILFKV